MRILTTLFLALATLGLRAENKIGFGMRKQNLPVDGWIERFSDWLEVQGLLKK